MSEQAPESIPTGNTDAGTSSAPNPVDLVANAFSGNNSGTPTPGSSAPASNIPQVPGSNPNTGGGHPAWQEILNEVPQALHDKVRPTLEKWDRGVEERFAQVHSQYEPYKPFVEQGITPQQIDAGMRLFAALQADPRQFYTFLGEQLGISPQQAQQLSQQVSGQGQQQDGSVDLGEFGDQSQQQQVDPRIAQHLQMLEQQQMQMQQFLAQQAQVAQAREADAWLNQKQAAIDTTFKQRGIELGKEDWNYILSVAAGHAQSNPQLAPDKALDMAVKSYETQLARFQSRPTANQSAPPVFAPSGGTPSTGFDASKLSDMERRNLMVQMLTQANKD